MQYKDVYLKLTKQKRISTNMNNAPYGKTIENVTKRNTIK